MLKTIHRIGFVRHFYSLGLAIEFVKRPVTQRAVNISWENSGGWKTGWKVTWENSNTNYYFEKV